MLPYFMLITTGAVVLVTVLYLRLYKIFMLGRAVLFSLIFFSVGTSWLWFEITHGSRIHTAVFYVWVGIVGTVAPVQAWTVISQCCVSRVGRRTIGFLGSGGIAGSIAGGLVARSVASHWGAPELLPAASLLMLMAVGLSLGLAKPVYEREKQSSSQD